MNAKRLVQYLVLSAALLSTSLVFAGNNNYSVGPDGSLNYTVDIKLPPGKKGIEPSLKLLFNSNAQNGILGEGWQLVGLPYITRDRAHGINYDGADHYLQSETGRLAAVTDASYTGTSVIYHNVEENFSRFEACGNTADGPEYWIETKVDGTKYYYGSTTDSKALAEDHFASSEQCIRKWALAKVEDIYGNYYTVEYEENGGELYPTQIVYTQGEGVSRYRTVEFSYNESTRVDYYDTNEGGARVTLNWTLKEVEIKTGVIDILGITFSGDRVRRYAVDYIDGLIVSRQKIQSITEYDSANVQANSITLGYDEELTYDSNGDASMLTGFAGWAHDDVDRIRVMDFDGNGLQDVVAGPDGNGKWFVVKSNGTGFTGETWLSAFGSWNGGKAARIRPADVNGDGRMDLVLGPENNSTGDFYILEYDPASADNNLKASTWQTDSEVQTWYNDEEKIHPVDVNGDGLSDIALGPDASGNYIILKSTGAGFEREDWDTNDADIAAWRNNTSRIFPADINGDGRSDFIFGPDASGNFMVLKNTGATFVRENWETNDPVDIGVWDDHTSRIRTMDVNGDGRTDMVFGPRSNGNWYVLRSTGAGFVKETWVSNVGRWYDNSKRIRPMDVNGDGFDDIVIGPDGNGKWFTLLSNGHSFVGEHQDQALDTLLITGLRAWDEHTSRIWTVSANYDNSVDIICGPNSSGKWFSSLSSSVKQLKTITESNGRTITVTMEPGKSLADTIRIDESSYPYVSNNAIGEVVTEINVSYEKGNNYTQSYSYSNAKRYMGAPDKTKSLYFQTMTESHSGTGHTKVTEYCQNAHQLAGRIKNVAEYGGTVSAANLMKNTAYTYLADYDSAWAVAGETGVYTTYAKQASAITTIYEGGSQLFQESVTFAQEDYNTAYGYQLKETKTTADGKTVVTDRTYGPLVDNTKWILARPASQSVTEDAVLAKKEIYEYDGVFLQVKKHFYGTGAADFISTTYSHDTSGNVVSVSKSRGTDLSSSPLAPSVATVAYDSDYNTFAETVTRENSEGIDLITITTYDPATGKKLEITDENGYTERNVYDNRGRLKEQWNKQGKQSKAITYDDVNDKVTTVNKVYDYDGDNTNTQTVIEEFDSLDRVIKSSKSIYDGGGHHLAMVEEIEYADNGKLLRKSQPYLVDGITVVETSLWSEYQYDARGRKTQETKPDGKIWKTEYAHSADGLSVKKYMTGYSSTKAHSKIFNMSGKIVKKLEPYSITINYTYDSSGRLLTMTGPDGAETSIVYDLLGRKISMVDPNTGLTSYTYYDSGEIKRSTDARSIVTSYTYDLLKRITSASSDDSTLSVTYTYDNESMANGKGRLTGISDGLTDEELAYDLYGNMAYKKVTVHESGSVDVPYVFTMKYDSSQRLTKMIYPDLAETTMQKDYSDNGSLKEVKWNDSTVVKYGRFQIGTSGTLNRDSTTVTRITGNGVRTDIEYDPVTELPQNIVTKMAKSSGTETYENMRYEYDEFANLKEVFDDLVTSGQTSRRQHYDYDYLDRIIGAQGNFGVLAYEYNHNGNLTLKSGVTLTYGDASHPHAVKSTGDGKTFAYDAIGNMISRNGKTLSYDVRNKLVSVYNGATLIEEYGYNHSGERVKRVKADGTVIYSIAGLYEVTVRPDGARLYSKNFYGIQNELAAQATIVNETLRTAYSPAVIDSTYNVASLSGLLGYVHDYASYITGKISTLRYLTLGGMFLVLFLLGLGVFHNREYYQRKRKRDILWPRRFAPALVFVIVAVFGFSGCEVSTGTAPGEWTKWEDVDYATLEGQGIKNQSIPGMYFYHPDQTGNISFVTDKNGDKISQFFYKPFGETHHIEGYDFTSKKYNSHQYDDAEVNGGTGLYYYKARYYDPTIGRFLTADWAIQEKNNSQSLNRYMYTAGNPVKYADPTGNFFKKIWKSIKKGFKALGSYIKKKWKEILIQIVVAIVRVVVTIYAGPIAGDLVAAGVEIGMRVAMKEPPTATSMFAYF